MKVRMFLLSMVGLGMVLLNSCADSGSDEFCSDPGITCTDPNAVIESCCTDTDCYWVYNGTRHDCNGTNCDDVYDIILTACTQASTELDLEDSDLMAMKAKLEAVTQDLLMEARAASGCCDY